MNLFFGMVASVFDFFVDLGNRVDFMGLNLFEISFIFFVFACIFRWLFPIIFAGEGSTPGGSVGSVFSATADSVKAIDAANEYGRGSQRANELRSDYKAGIRK